MRSLVLAVCLAGVALGGCASAPEARKAARRDARPTWQDVFADVPDIYAVVHPQVIRRDPVYGALWKAALRLAEARRLVPGASSLELLEGSDEIIFGLDPGRDAALVLRGVPASADPLRLRDEEGRALFRLASDRVSYAEYALVDRPDEERGSVFVLPGRTWIATFGAARSRARDAFERPSGRALPDVDGEALFVARFARRFVGQARYRESPVWGPLTRGLDHATMAMLPGKSGLLVMLAYADEGAAREAERSAARLLRELAQDDAQRFAWTTGAKVNRDARSVLVRVPLPERLIEELPRVTGADLPL